MAEITPVYLGQIERGEKNPTVKVVEKITDVFGLTLSDFFKDSDKTEVCESVDLYNISFEQQILAALRGLSDLEKDKIIKIVKEIIEFRNADTELK